MLINKCLYIEQLGYNLLINIITGIVSDLSNQL